MTDSSDPPAEAATGAQEADDLVRAQDFDARYGSGSDLEVSLGGGGVFFVAWQVAYLHRTAELGIELPRADRLVGTSAGSVVGAALGAGHIDRLFREVSLLAKAPKLVGLLAPTDDLHPSQLRARDLFATATDARGETVRSIGHAALAAQTPAASAMARNVSLIVRTRKWPASLHLTCVDAYTGERCVVTKAAKVGLARSVAASSAVPGLFAPQPIRDRRCMDGGVSGSGTHLDLLAGARRAVVLSLTDGSDVTDALMTVGVGAIESEFAALRASGTDVFSRHPEQVDLVTLMDPAAVPEAIAMGRRQASADAEDLRTFLA